MLRFVVRLDLHEDYVLSDVTRTVDQPLIVSNEEVHDDDTISFLVHVSGERDGIADQLAASEAVLEVTTVADSKLLVRKRPCGALPIIQEHNGLLFGVDRVFDTERAFDILAFDREDVANILREFRRLGTPSVDRITPVGEQRSVLSDRQEEVITAALEAGYFDWPREIEAVDLAEQLDISHPTLLEHLRKAEKKLLRRALTEQAFDAGLAQTTRDDLDDFV